MKSFNRKALDLALAWSKHDQKTLGDLVERLQKMPEQDQDKVWDLIDRWANSEADDSAKASLRERIRLFTLTRRGQRSGVNDATRDQARMVCSNLQPGDPIVKHAWLFANPWVDFSADDVEDGAIDHAKHEEKIHGLRFVAMKEIWAKRGFEGVMALLSEGGATDIVGAFLALIITGANPRVDFLRQCLSITGSSCDLERDIDGGIQGFLRSVDDKARGTILSAAAEGADIGQTVHLFRCAPFGQNTWRLLDGYGKEIQDRYWQEVFSHWNHHSEEELIELIDRLLEADRPRAAFNAVDFEWSRIETSRLKRLLRAVAAVDAEPVGHYKLKDYQISEALNSLDGREGVSLDEMARLLMTVNTVFPIWSGRLPNPRAFSFKSWRLYASVAVKDRIRRNGGSITPSDRLTSPWPLTESLIKSTACRVPEKTTRSIPKLYPPGWTKCGASAVNTVAWRSVMNTSVKFWPGLRPKRMVPGRVFQSVK